VSTETSEEWRAQASAQHGAKARPQQGAHGAWSMGAGHGGRVGESSSTWWVLNGARWAAIWARSGPIWTMGSKAKLQPTRHSIIFIETTLSLELWIKRQLHAKMKMSTH
jgi:hypothetical protein